MSSQWMIFGLLFVFIVSACASQSDPATSTSVPPTPTMDSHTISFTTPDGATIDGTLYGSGPIGVIFSVMGNCKRGWENIANLVAQNNMMALTYRWRGCRDNGSADNDEMKKFVDDLRGAVAFVRKLGAKRIILAGASLGGVASAKIAAESQADGLIVIASPSEIPEWGFRIESADVNVNIPKLFISAEHDDTVAIDKTRALFELAAEPKEWQTYPGAAHGTDLFETQNKEELQKRLLNFIVAIATLPQPI